MKILFVLACMGFLGSALVHFSTYFGLDPSEPFPYIWLLHLGALVIFIPSLVIMFTMFPKDEKGHPQLGTGAPKWMQWATGVTGVLAIGNFVLFIVVMLFWGTGAIRNGQYVQENVHRQIVRQITAGEYHRYNAGGIRMFSSFWIFIYSLGMMILVSAIVYRKLDETPGLPATELGDDPKGIPLWVQNLRILAVFAIGLWTGPVILVATTIVFHLKFGFIATVLFFPSGIAGFLVARRLLKGNKAPEMCPKCGGRIVFVGRRGMQYRCAHCEWRV